MPSNKALQTIAVANGIGHASRLDGWADLERDAVRMSVDRYSFDPQAVRQLA